MARKKFVIKVGIIVVALLIAFFLCRQADFFGILGSGDNCVFQAASAPTGTDAKVEICSNVTADSAKAGDTIAINCNCQPYPMSYGARRCELYIDNALVKQFNCCGFPPGVNPYILTKTTAKQVATCLCQNKDATAQSSIEFIAPTQPEPNPTPDFSWMTTIVGLVILAGLTVIALIKVR